MEAGGSLGLILVLSGVTLLAIVISRLPIRKDVRRLVVGGMALRVIGSLAYLYLIDSLYGGGDFNLYFRGGLEYAEILLSGDFQAITDPWTRPGWWGTSFTIHMAGIVVSIIGPTLPGTFVVFGLIGYLGIVAIGLAFTRAFPATEGRRYLAWLILFPSLWFWPAALGKDALVLCGIGLATLGFVGRSNRVRWLLLGSGVVLVFCVRPQVAATLTFALAAGHWMETVRTWNLRRILQGSVFLLAGFGVVTLSSGALGVELFRPDEVEGYFDITSERTTIGGSAVGGSARWLGPVNTLLRPFPWEARGIPSALASLEVVLLIGVALYRRREIGTFLRAQRGNRLFWAAMIFVLSYATALGVALGNLGIIARQRVHLLPFLFMFLAGGSKGISRPLRRPPMVADSTAAGVGSQVGVPENPASRRRRES